MTLLRFACLSLTVACLSGAVSAADAPAAPASAGGPDLAEGWAPPSPETVTALGLLPADTVIVGKKHALLDRWTKAFGLTEAQRLWIEPQLHAEESLTKPVLGYKALNAAERKQILLVIKLAARRQIRNLLTPAQQKLMDQEIDSTKTGS